MPSEGDASYERELFGIIGDIAGLRAAIGAVVVEDIRVTEVRGDGRIASEAGEFDREGDLKGCINDIEVRLCIPVLSTDLREDLDPWTDRRFMYTGSAGELLSEAPGTCCARDTLALFPAPCK